MYGVNTSMSFLEIDKNFILPQSFDVAQLEHVPFYTHVYGNKAPDVAGIFWQEFQQANNLDGSISFLRNMQNEYPNFTQYVADYIQRLLPLLKINPIYVKMIRTKNNVNPHADEPTRRCCINIGVKNSAGAITRTSNTTSRDEFIHKSIASQCQDLSAYLIDTSKMHSVTSINSNPRYLITYPFIESFDTIAKHFKERTLT